MQEQDLLQIKKIIDDSLEEKLESKLEEKLESKLEKKFRENNEILRQEISQEISQKIKDSEDIVTSAVKQSFADLENEMNEKFENMQEELNKKANEATVLSWGDEKITPVKLDVDKLKYLHKNEWKNLPDSGTVSRILAEEGIKA